MEAAGLALGVLGAVGVLGQMFDGCIKGYRVFSTASNLGRDSERLVCKIRIEETRLWVWGRQCGVVEGKFEAHLAAGTWGHEGLKDLATEVLAQLLQTITDCNKLQEKYGLREEAPGSVDKEAYMAYKKSADLKSFRAVKVKDEWRLRARWVIADKEQFENFLKDLQYFNDSLEKLFPPGQVTTLQRAWTSELLQSAERNTGSLELLENASSGRYPGLTTFAQLKRLRINLDAKEPSRKILSTSELKQQQWRIKVPPGEDSVGTRVRAVYQRPQDAPPYSEDVPVLVEWIPYDAISDLDARLHLYQRVDNLSRMLHSCSSRHPDLHTLDSAGYVDDSPHSRYGIIYLGPSQSSAGPSTMPPFHTLSAAIENQGKRTPDLEARFSLARTLAIALWSFHSLDWLHKSFCSHNILFFSSSSDTSPRSEHHDLSAPYVVGFDSSRPDGLAEMTADPRFAHGEDLYRHPDSLGVWRQSYRKAFDVYSLGLVLLEIGLWNPKQSIRSMHKARYSPAVFREKIIQGAVPALGSKTGSTYRGVVERCLGFNEESQQGGEGMNPNQMMEWVVRTLESLRV
ncbi:hypothetical protein H2201_001288 [Coniosporium apollinis]|uniref:Protein kinase domain-containing protein n=2 Tax=Coniosporium TaxID=2810619 RepID=A0ABQ9P5N2_9PEZI|nr:hypothetical protein H2199_001698 [Cladosporium sp. JES 115]KAJ9668646.1 hypothetical protein H2201_001288 [Coniosporium apollinis]